MSWRIWWTDPTFDGGRWYYAARVPGAVTVAEECSLYGRCSEFDSYADAVRAVTAARHAPGRTFSVRWPGDGVPDEHEDEHDEPSYVNEECPFHCDERHDLPGWGRDMRCPATDEYFYRCDDCGDYNEVDANEVDLNGTGLLICPHCHDEYTSCQNCGWVERNGSRLCDSCYEAEVDEDDYPHEPGIRSTTCAECGTRNDWFLELTEEYVCEHVANEARARKVPVLAPVAA